MNRYRIDDLDVEGIPVIWTMPSGQDMEGYLAITARGRRVYRVYTDSPRRRQSADLPTFSKPALWRPLFAARWPDVLPAPAVLVEPTYDQNAKPEPSPTTEQVGEPDDWPYPDLILGLGKPSRIEEAEARVLRAIRTTRALERLDDRPGGDTLWPPALMFKARMVAKALRNSRTGKLPFLSSGDYSDFHIDRSELRAFGELWIPTRRDVGDVENGIMRWMADLTRRQDHIVNLRAASPVYSWRAISSYFDQDEDRVRGVYADALQSIWGRAVA